MDDVSWEHVFIRFVDEIILFELLCHEVLVVDVEGVEFVGHQFRFRVKWDRFVYIFTRKNVCLADCCFADHHFIIVVIILGKFIEIEVAVSEVHYVMKTLFCD